VGKPEPGDIRCASGDRRLKPCSIYEGRRRRGSIARKNGWKIQWIQIREKQNTSKNLRQRIVWRTKAMGTECLMEWGNEQRAELLISLWKRRIEDSYPLDRILKPCTCCAAIADGGAAEGVV
jgi:hypothetical protein